MAVDIESLDKAIDAIKKRRGLNAIRYGNDQPSLSRIPVESPAIMRITSGGIPMGRVTRFWGEPGAGKSLFAYNIVKAAQELITIDHLKGLSVCWWDIEKCFEKNFAEHLGIDTSKLLVNPTDLIEDIGNEMPLLMGSINLHIIDSYSDAIPVDRVAKDTGDWDIGLKVRVWEKAFEKIMNSMDKDENSIISISHASRDFKTKSEKALDGKEIEHKSSLSIHFKKTKWLYYDDEGLLQTEDKLKEKGILGIGGQKEADGQEIVVRVNKCVTGDTKVHTIDGIKLAKDLSGTVMTLSEGGVYRPAIWSQKGIAPIYEVVFSTGDTAFVTDNHEWVISERKHNVRQKIKTTGLMNKKVPYQPILDFVYNKEDFEEGVRHGMVYGDGTLYDSHKILLTKYSRLDQFVLNDCEVMDKFFKKSRANSGLKSITTPRRVLSSGAYRVSGLPAEWRELPSLKCSQSYLRGFVSGLIEADGHINKKSMVYIYCANLEEIKQIRIIAQYAGLSTNRISKSTTMTTGGALAERWGNKKYPRNVERHIYSLFIGKKSFFNLDGSVDDHMVLKKNHKYNLLQSGPPKMDLYAKVINIKKTDRVEPVYCCEEPTTNTWVIGNGLLTCNSKICKPFRKGNLRLDFHTTKFDHIFELMDGALYFDKQGNIAHRSGQPAIASVTSKQGGWCTLPGGEKIQGEKNLRKRIAEDTELQQMIRKAMLAGQ